MKLWLQELDNIPADKNGLKECNGAMSALVVFKFFEEEIYPRFEIIKSELSNQDLKIEISPSNISSNKPCISITIQKQLTRNICDFSLEFNVGRPELIINSILTGNNGCKTLGDIDINGDNYNELIDLYVSQLLELIK